MVPDFEIKKKTFLDLESGFKVNLVSRDDKKPISMYIMKKIITYTMIFMTSMKCILRFNRKMW